MKFYEHYLLVMGGLSRQIPLKIVYSLTLALVRECALYTVSLARVLSKKTFKNDIFGMIVSTSNKVDGAQPKCTR